MNTTSEEEGELRTLSQLVLDICAVLSCRLFHRYQLNVVVVGTSPYFFGFGHGSIRISCHPQSASATFTQPFSVGGKFTVGIAVEKELSMEGTARTNEIGFHGRQGKGERFCSQNAA